MAAGLKARRQRRIATVLRRSTIGSQAELAAALRKQGEQVTQATLSRDLEEMGATKSRLSDGRIAYRLPDEPRPETIDVQRMLTEFLVDVTPSGSLVVLRTPPGCAQPVARAIDTGNVENIIGTVAGDDTILVICREGVTGRTVARHLEALASGGRKGA